MEVYNLDIYKGSSYSGSFYLKDYDSNTINLSGCSVSGQLKYKYSDTLALTSFNVDVKIPSSGLISMRLTPAQTSALPIGLSFYDVEIYNSGDASVYKPIYGRASIYPEVTM